MSAVVFDLDGTLTDTEHIRDVVRRGLAEAEGLPWPAEAVLDSLEELTVNLVDGLLSGR